MSDQTLTITEDKLSIEIGGVGVALASRQRGHPLELDAPYRAFLTSRAKPSINLVVRISRRRLRTAGRLLFENTPWRVHGLGDGRHRYTIIGGRRPRRLLLLADFSPNYYEGEIIHPPTFFNAFGPDSPLRPLLHPLGQLIWLNYLSRQRLGLPLHALGVKRAGVGLLFPASSGGGKSTLARYFPRRQVLSDERVIVRHRRGGLHIYGTPWHGEEPRFRSARAPLHHIFLLQHGSRNRLLPLGRTEAVRRLLLHAFPTLWNREGLEFGLEFCREVAEAVECNVLEFKPGAEVLELIDRMA